MTAVPLSLRPLRHLQHLQQRAWWRLYRVLIALWVLAMICVPIARWIWGDAVIPMASVITTTLQFAAVLAVLHSGWGTGRTLRALVIIAGVTYLAELVGSKTGFPFGAYHYTGLLQPQLFGVPVIIPLAWLMMLAPSWAAAYLILGRDLSTPIRRAGFVLLSALAITAWDLYLDPQMVGWGFWVWQDSSSGYFGIPWVNFFGWILTAIIATALVRPAVPLPALPLLVIYAIVWILQSIGLAVFWGQPGPAFFGFLAMGTTFVWTAAAELRRRAGLEIN
jgi:putative membrane protein